MLQKIIEGLNTRGWKVFRVFLFVGGAFFTLAWVCVELYHTPAIQDAGFGRVMIWMGVGFSVTAVVYGWLELERVYSAEPEETEESSKPELSSEQWNSFCKKLEKQLKKDVPKIVAQEVPKVVLSVMDDFNIKKKKK
ncbi:hypothetical protein ACFL5K_03500 [Gemmatimonadota bacterium]